MSSSPNASPAIPKLQLGHFQTGGGWGLGDQFARLPPAAEQERSNQNIYRVAPDGPVSDGLRASGGGGGGTTGPVPSDATAPTASTLSPNTLALRAVPETNYLPGGGDEDDDDTFVDHGSTAHGPVVGGGGGVTSAMSSVPASQPVPFAKGATLRPPVVKPGPPVIGAPRLTSPLQTNTASISGTEGPASTSATHTPAAIAATRSPLMASTNTTNNTITPLFPPESRTGMVRSRPAVDGGNGGSTLPPGAGPSTAHHARLQAAAPASHQPTSAATHKAAPALWDPPRVVSRMSLTYPVRDMAVDPRGDRLWMAVGDDPLAMLMLRGTNLYTFKTVDSVSQVYCMTVVEVPSGRQTTFKNAEEKRTRKKRRSSSPEVVDTSAATSRFELWCGAGRGNIEIVDLEHGSENGSIPLAHSQPLERIWCLANGKVWSAGRDKAVRVWDPQTRRKLKNRNIAAILRDVAYVPHTRQVWATADDNVIRVYEGGGDNAVLQRPGHDKNDNLIRMKADVNSLAYHADANVIWVCMSRTTAIMDPSTYEIAVTLSAGVSAVSFHKKTAIVAGQGAFFMTDTCCLAVLDVTDPLSPSMLFRGISVDAVNRIGLRLFLTAPLAVIAHDEGKVGNKKRKLSVFTYEETAPLATYTEPDESSRPPQQRQETVGFRNIVGRPSAGGGTAGASALGGSTTLLGARHLGANANAPAGGGGGHLALTGATSSPFTAVTAASNGVTTPSAAARHVNHTTTNMLSLAAMSNLAGDGHSARSGGVGVMVEPGSTTAVIDTPAPTRPVHRDAEAVITPGPAAALRSAEAGASLSKLEKRTEEVFSLLTNTRRTEGPLADLAKLHGEASTWLINSDVSATLPPLPREDAERVEREYWSPEGRVLATLMARLRLAVTSAASRTTADEPAGMAMGAGATYDGESSRRSPQKGKSPQSPASSVSLVAVNGVGQTPPAANLASSGSTGHAAPEHAGGASLAPAAQDSKLLTVDPSNSLLATTSTLHNTVALIGGAPPDALTAGGSSPALIALAGPGPESGTDTLSSEAVLQWVAQLSRTAQEERRLHQRQLQSLQRHNKRIAERNVSLVNGMTKVCESVRNWGQRVSDEADTQWTQLSPQANPIEADRQHLFINITRGTLAELDDVLTTSGPREIRQYVSRMQTCLLRIAALQEKMRLFSLTCATASRSPASPLTPAPHTHRGGDSSTPRGGEDAAVAVSRPNEPRAPLGNTDSSAPFADQADSSRGAQSPPTHTVSPQPTDTTATTTTTVTDATPTTTADSAETIIEAGFSVPLSPAQFVSFMPDELANVSRGITDLANHWRRTCVMHRLQYAPYYTAAQTSSAPVSDAPAWAREPVPHLNLGEDISAYPVLWDLSVAHMMFMLCVHESEVLIFDALLSDESLLQCVPVREDSPTDALTVAAHAEGDDNGDSRHRCAARFQSAVVGTHQFTQLLLEDLRENTDSVNGLTPSLQRRMLIAGLFHDFDSSASREETMSSMVALSRQVAELSEQVEETGRRVRSDLADTLERLTGAVDVIERGATGEAEPPHPYPGSDMPADVEEVRSGSFHSHSSPLNASGRPSAVDTTRPSSTVPQSTITEQSHGGLLVYGGFLGMDSKPLIYEGRLRGGLYWAHVFLDFLHDTLKLCGDLLSPEKLKMPRDNFFAMLDLIGQWGEELFMMESICTAVRHVLATTQTDIEDVAATVSPHLCRTGHSAATLAKGGRALFPQSASGAERVGGLPAASGSSTLRDRAGDGASTTDMTALRGSPVGTDSWLRSMRAGTRRGVAGDGGAGAAVGGSAGGVGVTPGSGATGASSGDAGSSSHTMPQHSFALKMFSACMRVYLHQACVPTASTLRNARSLDDLDGCLRQPLLLQTDTSLSSQNGIDNDDAEGVTTESLPRRVAPSPDGSRSGGVNLAKSPRAQPGQADTAAADGDDALDALSGMRVSLQEIIASVDLALLKARRAMVNCRTLHARVTTIIEENTKMAAVAEESKTRASASRRGTSLAHVDPSSHDRDGGDIDASADVVQLAPNLLAGLGSLPSSSPLVGSHCGAGTSTGGAGAGAHGLDAHSGGSGAHGESSPHRASRHHHRKASSSSGIAGVDDGSVTLLRRRHSDTPDTLVAPPPTDTQKHPHPE